MPNISLPFVAIASVYAATPNLTRPGFRLKGAGKATRTRHSARSVHFRPPQTSWLPKGIQAAGSPTLLFHDIPLPPHPWEHRAIDIVAYHFSGVGSSKRI